MTDFTPRQTVLLDRIEKLCERAKTLGESADGAALRELSDLTRSQSARVRRLAASAIGKLAGLVPSDEAVGVLTALLQDAHPQCRQYSAKSLPLWGLESSGLSRFDCWLSHPGAVFG